VLVSQVDHDISKHVKFLKPHKTIKEWDGCSFDWFGYLSLKEYHADLFHG